MMAVYDTLLSLGWTQLVQLTIVLAVIAIVIHFTGRRRPHLAYLLCLLGMVKCLTPPLVSSPAGLFSRMTAISNTTAQLVPTRNESVANDDRREPIATSTRKNGRDRTARTKNRDRNSRTIVSSIEREDIAVNESVATIPPTGNDSGFIDRQTVTQDRSSRLPGPESHAASSSIVSSLSFIPWRAVIGGVWLFGATLATLWVFGQHLRGLRLVQRCDECTDFRLNALLANVAEQLGIRLAVRKRCQLLISSDSIGPAVFGCRKPRVILPAQLQTLPSDRLAPILAHELAHFRRGDTWTVWLQVAAKIVWWFHPGVWWISRETARLRELCCDEETLASCQCDPGEYAQGLLDVLKQKQVCKPAFALNGMRPLEITKQRLGYIMQNRKSLYRRTPIRWWLLTLFAAGLILPGAAWLTPETPDLFATEDTKPMEETSKDESEKTGEPTVASNVEELIPTELVPAGSNWSQFLGGSNRNNASLATNLPQDFSIEDDENVRWQFATGSLTSPAVHDGRVFIGASNRGNWLKRIPPEKDIACLQAIDLKTGKHLWQYTSERLPTGRVHDWPMFSMCAVPFIDGDRLWVVTNRAEVVCLDTRGFRDGENDGPIKDEEFTAKNEADIIWKFDMMTKLGVRPHNLSLSSITGVGELIFLNTGNGVDESHLAAPKPSAPSFLALNRNTGAVVWTDASPGDNVLHGQWSSPTYAVIEDVPQIIFAGGDGWLYSFDVRDIQRGVTNQLWKFDCNPKRSKWILGGRGTRNNLVATPVVYKNRVYIAVGQDPEHGEGSGRLLCIDATMRGDLSEEIVYNKKEPMKPIPHRRLQACDEAKGDYTLPNTNTGLVWVFEKEDSNGDGKIEFEEEMHRAISSVAIKEDRLYISDGSGLLHCINARNGKQHWSYDLFAHASGTPVIADGKVYAVDEDGDVTIINDSTKFKLIAEPLLPESIAGTPVAVGNTLLLSGQHHLYAIGKD